MGAFLRDDVSFHSQASTGGFHALREELESLREELARNVMGALRPDVPQNHPHEVLCLAINGVLPSADRHL